MNKADNELRAWFLANKDRVDANGTPIGLAEAAAEYVKAKKAESDKLRHTLD